MAGFEGLERMTDKLEEAYQKAKNKAEHEANYGSLARMFDQERKADAFLESLVLFYETALQHGKFISQRKYCENAIRKMNPAFAEGYFKGKK